MATAVGQHLIDAEKDLAYCPPPPIDPAFQKQFERLVPICPNGKDRLIKFVWGNDRREWVNGVMSIRYTDMENEPAKYVGRCGWVLEGWNPPDVYDREEWSAVEAFLGPFPESGVFDFLAYHEDEDGGFLPLDNSALERVRAWKWWQGEGKKKSIEHLIRKRALRAQINLDRRREAAEAVADEGAAQIMKEFEKAKDTPDAWSFADTVKSTNFTTTNSGIIVPKGSLN